MVASTFYVRESGVSAALLQLVKRQGIPRPQAVVVRADAPALAWQRCEAPRLT